jgi:hypothetical protein
MRKFLLAATAISMLLAFSPSQAATKTIARKNITFKAQAACLVACAHNMYGNTQAVADLAAEGNPAAEYFETCAKPGPAGSYADFVVTVPKKTNALMFSIFPNGDWDSYICTKPARGPSTIAGEGANSWPSDIPPTGEDLNGPLGIRETTIIAVKPGQRYILRAYNWLDTGSCTGEYRFLYMR